MDIGRGDTDGARNVAQAPLCEPLSRSATNLNHCDDKALE